MKAIVLCGGLGTRLGNLTRETPKPLIDVAGRPFIAHVLDHLVENGVQGIVLAVSFQWEKLRDCIGSIWCGVPVTYSVEQYPLGTGGAIKHAMLVSNLQSALVVNGDTLLLERPKKLHEFSLLHNADVGLALKLVKDATRFGTVEVADDRRVLSFREKGITRAGYVNTGMYWVEQRVFEALPSERFSFELDVLAAQSGMKSIYGLETQAYFIDMGIPDDLERARFDLAGMTTVRLHN